MGFMVAVKSSRQIPHLNKTVSDSLLKDGEKKKEKKKGRSD
jgi:hypothetical protein